MDFKEASEMYMMYKISFELTCQCDEELMVICQQCLEEDAKLSTFETTLGQAEQFNF